MRKIKVILIILGLITLALLSINYFNHHPVAVLDPSGPIALKERNLFLLTIGLMLIVVIPVFILTALIVYKYRDGHRAKYSPDFDHSVILESIWWLIPGALIFVLSIVIWNSSHTLDPYRAISASMQPMKVEVVALDWKWLFIYPDKNIASVNQLNLPVNRPVTFYITADAPMNSLWIPQLGGQIYAMAGMSTQLNLMATKVGNYYGSSANISGNGFSSMHFFARAMSTQAFSNWQKMASKSPHKLSQANYQLLARDSSNYPITNYSSVVPNLYVSVINKYMVPPGGGMSGMAGM